MCDEEVRDSDSVTGKIYEFGIPNSYKILIPKWYRNIGWFLYSPIPPRCWRPCRAFPLKLEPFPNIVQELYCQRTFNRLKHLNRNVQ